MWKQLGFSDSPYDARPLRPAQADVNLLVGREEESIELCTLFESSEEGVAIISGPPGVGKTSFLNIQQHLLSTGASSFGPKLLPATQLSSVNAGEGPKKVALRVLDCLTRSVKQHCSAEGKKLPKETATVEKWLRSKGASGFDVGITILGCGGNFGQTSSLPPVAEASFEAVQDAISCVAAEAVNKLDFEGVIAVLDNVENLSDDELKATLFAFRDTLFMTPRMWWVIIGQSGLGSLVQTLDPRVSDRIAGSGLELSPISLEELEQAVSLRVEKFSSTAGAKSPLPNEVHRQLYEASHGEIRFVFKYASTLCQKFVEMIRKQVGVLAKGSKGPVDPAVVANSVATHLLNAQIPEDRAQDILVSITEREISGFALKPKDRQVLQKIGERGTARAKDFANYGLKSGQDFSSNYLTKFHQQHLLARRQEGRAVHYSLRGVAALGSSMGLLGIQGTRASA